MTNVVSAIEIPRPPAEVWDLIGGFGSLLDWLPAIPRTEVVEGGRVRRLTLADGSAVVERLIAFDEAGRSYSYAILESAFPLTDYLATIAVSEAPNGCQVRWTASFAPVGEEEAPRSLIQTLFDGGLAGLAGQFGTSPQTIAR